MLAGERKVGLASISLSSQAGLDYNKKCESAPKVPDGASPKISKTILEFKNLVYVRYYDHVLFNRSSAMLMAPLIREAAGWLVYECEQYITMVMDRDARPPTLKGNSDPKATGLVLLRSDIVEFKRFEDFLPPKISFEHSLNSQIASLKNRVCASSHRSEKLRKKSRKGAKNL